MHIFTLENKEALLSYLERELQSRLGIKASALKVKKNNKRQSTLKTRIFQKSLDSLPKQPVLLKSGGVVDVPCFIVDLCQAIGKNFDTEGIFRKAGSSARQREIKAHFEAGGPVQEDFHEVDLANILKLFLRELPEPLIPNVFQDVFAKAHKQSSEFMLLLCMLLPSTNLHVLAFLAQFFNEVGSHSKSNLMPASNLAIVLSPSVMPFQDHRHGKLNNHAQLHDNNIKTLEIIILEAIDIGDIPMALGYQLGLIEDSKSDELASNASLDSIGSNRKSRKRRSGSLTRMFNGLRKMVGGGTKGGSSDDDCKTPAGITPLIKSAKKRKAETPGLAPFSAKRKLEVLHCMPNGAMLSSTPAKSICLKPMPPDTPAQSLFYVTPPVNSVPNPQKTIKKSPHPQGLKLKQRSRFFTPRSKSESILQRVIGTTEQKKPRLSFGGKKVSKKQLVKPPKTSPPKTILESADEMPNPSKMLKRKKSWSSLGGSWGRNMRRLAPVTFTDTPLLMSPYAPRLRTNIAPGLGGATAHVNLSPTSSTTNLQSQYDEIKSKVNQLESQLNQVLNQAELEAEVPGSGHTASFVQNQYEKTLEDSEPFNTCQTTDQLAKRLSRGLKIRRSGENKVIRSPSARKIGSLRRRSKESGRVVRTASGTKLSQSPVRRNAPQQRSLQRGRPNSVLTGLTQPSPGQLQRSTVTQSPSSFFSTSLTQPSPMQVQTPKQDSSAWCAPAEVKKKSPHFAVPMSPFVGPLTRSVVRRASFQAMDSPMPPSVKKTPSFGSVGRDEPWLDARSFMSQATPSRLDSVGRPSIAEIKMKRAGMVLASLKLFENSPDGKKPQVKRLSTDRVKESSSSPVISPRRKSLSRRVSVGRTPTIAERSHYLPSDLKSPNAKVETPSAWEKENVSSPCDTLRLIKTHFSPQMEIPAGLKETIYDVCTPKVPLVKSPLAALDVNKLTPKQCPTIKKPLSVRPVAASALRRTPYHAYATPCGNIPMLGTPLRRSPRFSGHQLTFSP